jgi:hypothetical protein
MNISTIRKNYDKLTAKERFAAIMAAVARGDGQEQKALVQSAPRKQWSIATTYGLSEAFRFLSMWHVMNQLGYAATYLYLLGVGDEFGDKSFNFCDTLARLERRILEGREAWHAICQEYGIDSETMLKNFPFVEMIDMAESSVRDMNQENPLDLPNLEERINTLREVIESIRKEWE